MSLLLALTGGSAGAYTLTAATGSYALSGQAANLLKSRVLVSAVGGYALTGVAASLARSHKLTAATGAYVYTGVAANLLYTPSAGAYTLTANAGSYSLAGNDASLTHGVVTSSPSGEVILQRKKIYVKRGKQYLIFNNNEEADSYLAAEQAIETAKKSSRGAAKRVIKALKVVKPEVIQEPKLDELSNLIAKFNVDYDLIQAQKNNDIEALIAIQSMLYRLQQDEEDIELLLLSV